MHDIDNVEERIVEIITEWHQERTQTNGVPSYGDVKWATRTNNWTTNFASACNTDTTQNQPHQISNTTNRGI